MAEQKFTTALPEEMIAWLKVKAAERRCRPNVILMDAIQRSMIAEEQSGRSQLQLQF